MNRVLFKDLIVRDTDYQKRCKCNEEVSTVKKRKNTRSERKPFRYPHPNEETDEIKVKVRFKTFYIKYQKNLSSIATLLLNSFQNKYLYYAVDDILYSLKSNPTERDNLLAILYSPVLSLQNNLFINFSDIWISKIQIRKVKKANKFLTTNPEIYESVSYITIKFIYRFKSPRKKQESIW